jgi:hypothetical protein
MLRRSSRSSTLVTHDIGIVVLSVLVAVIIARTDIIITTLTSTQELQLIGSFVAGMFFTSIFTTAPAMVTLGEIAQVDGLVTTVVLGGLGAVLGDLIIFRFVKDRLSEHITALLRERGVLRRARKVCTTRFCHWLPLFLGGVVLASPLPDELGVSILGVAKMRPSRFMLMSFFFNSIGILVIGLIARGI